MALEIGRKLSAAEPTAFIDEIKHRMYAPWNEKFSAPRSCDLEAGKLPIETIRLFWCEPSGNAVRKPWREFWLL